MTERGALLAEAACVGTVEDITGHEVAAWVMPSLTWRGSPRFRPRLERHFVSWGIWWQGRRYRSFEQAAAKALAVLAGIDARGGRQERPT